MSRCTTQRLLTFFCAILPLGLVPDIVEARKELLSQDEKDQLRKVERIHLELLTLTGKGPVDGAAVQRAASERLASLGYRIEDDRAQPADLTVKIKCEELKTWEGTGRSGGDADMVDAAARLWKGPACQITYRSGQRTADWRHEVRTPFANPLEAAKKAGQSDSGIFAIGALAERIKTDDFPFLLAADLGHVDRLVSALERPDLTKAQKVTVIGLIGGTQSAEAIPRVTALTKDTDPDVAAAAATALGTIGDAGCIPPLLTLMSSDKPDQRRMAAVGLGRLAPLYPNSEIVPTLLKALPSEPVPTQILVVRALGKTTDRRILEPLRALHRSVLKRPPGEITPELAELKSTLGIALDQFDGTHTEE